MPRPPRRTPRGPRRPPASRPEHRPRRAPVRNPPPSTAIRRRGGFSLASADVRPLGIGGPGRDGGPLPVRAETAVRTTGLMKAYGSAASPAYALRGVSLDVAEGERAGLARQVGLGQVDLAEPPRRARSRRLGRAERRRPGPRPAVAPRAGAVPIRDRRTREIGVMKSVGADNRRLLVMFLIEGAVIGLVRGGFGFLLAWAVSYPGDARVQDMVLRDLDVELDHGIFVFPPLAGRGRPGPPGRRHHPGESGRARRAFGSTEAGRRFGVGGPARGWGGWEGGSVFGRRPDASAD